MPNRIVREGIIDSERVNSLSPLAELFYRRLMSKVDDYGRFSGHPALILAACFPLQLDRVTQADVSAWLAECCQLPARCAQRIPLISLYEVNGKKYLQVNDFNQRTRSESKYPPPSVRDVLAVDGAVTAEKPHDVGHYDGHVADNCGSRATSPSPSPSPNIETHAKPKTQEAPSEKFEEWWKLWSAVRGTNHRINAEGVYIRTVTVAAEAACFECTVSYLNSLDNPAKGYNPENFLIEQARDGFGARWPAVRRADGELNVPTATVPKKPLKVVPYDPLGIGANGGVVRQREDKCK